MQSTESQSPRGQHKGTNAETISNNNNVDTTTEASTLSSDNITTASENTNSTATSNNNIITDSNESTNNNNNTVTTGNTMRGELQFRISLMDIELEDTPNNESSQEDVL